MGVRNVCLGETEWETEKAMSIWSCLLESLVWFPTEHLKSRGWLDGTAFADWK